MERAVYRNSAKRWRIQAAYTNVRRYDPATNKTLPCSPAETAGAWEILSSNSLARLRETDSSGVYVIQVPDTGVLYELRKPGAGRMKDTSDQERAKRLARLAVARVARQEEAEEAERNEPGAYDAVSARILLVGQARDVIIVTTANPEVFLALHGQDGDELAQAVKQRAAEQAKQKTQQKRKNLGPYLAALAQVLRDERELTTQQIADEFGVSAPTLYRYLDKEDGAA